MTLAVARHPGGRPTNSQLSDRLERSRLRNVLLTEEVRALTAERRNVGIEIEALARRIDLSIRADRPDLALHVAGRLEALAHALNPEEVA